MTLKNKIFSYSSVFVEDMLIIKKTEMYFVRCAKVHGNVDCISISYVGNLYWDILYLITSLQQNYWVYK